MSVRWLAVASGCLVSVTASAQATAPCDGGVDRAWVRTLALAAESAWGGGQLDGVRVSAEALEARAHCLTERVSPAEAAGMHRLLAMRSLLDSGSEVAVRHLAAAARYDTDWDLATADEGVLGQAWRRALVQPPAGQQLVEVPEGAQLWVDGMPAVSVPTGRPALVQITVDGALSRSRLTGAQQAPSSGWKVVDDRSRLDRTLGLADVVVDPAAAPAGVSSGPAMAIAPVSSTGEPQRQLSVHFLLGAELGVGFGDTLNRFTSLAFYNENGAIDKASWDRMEGSVEPMLSLTLGLRVGDFFELRGAVGFFGAQQLEDVAGYTTESCVAGTLVCPPTGADAVHEANSYWITAQEDRSRIGGFEVQARVTPWGIGPVRPLVLAGVMSRFYFSSVEEWSWSWQVGAGARVDLGKSVQVSLTVPVAPVQDGMDFDLYKGGDTRGNDLYVVREGVDPIAFARVMLGIDLVL